MIVKHELFMQVSLAGLPKLFLEVYQYCNRLSYIYSSFVVIVVVKLAICIGYLAHREQFYVWFIGIIKCSWLDKIAHLIYGTIHRKF